MILERLTLCDFRAYRDLKAVDLAPRVRYGAERPIILFGGLNGAGKTTLMMAIKLALYGRHALGMGTSASTYNRFLRHSVHASSALLVACDEAFVEIDFTYGKLGEQARYTVRRSWSNARRVHEKLSVSQDGEPLPLSAKACQGFLNDLVPIGVSDLFFFDGEKIAELAEDETGRILGDAIQRLLGLHLVERLRNDLRVYLLRQQTNGTDRVASDEISRLQSEYEGILREVDVSRADLTSAKRALAKLVTERDRLDILLSEQGGDWSTSRESWQATVADLSESLKKAKRELREELAGIYPLALASNTLFPALEAASTNLGALTQAEANDLLASFASRLKIHLDESSADHLERLLKDTIKPIPSAETLLDVSHRALGRMEQSVHQSIPAAKARVERLIWSIQNTKDELDAITLRIEQAPDEATLAADLEKLAALNKQVDDASIDVAARSREIRSRYRLAIEKARGLRDKHATLSKRQDTRQPLEYAERARRMLKDFGSVKAKRKIAELEYEFCEAFQELARKDDLVAKARVDPRNFTVRLLNKGGRELRMGQLSAGERQIYAIAMLDALARTSGRRLPIVIDTPLGRLDSQHRKNLVTNYFPRASHQVILLSTDVEVDQPFYRELSPHVSHAFEIRHDNTEQASTLQEGYFWRPQARMTG